MTAKTRAVLTQDRPVAIEGRSGRRKNWVWRLSVLAMAGVLSYTAVSFWSLSVRLGDMRHDASELQQELWSRQGRSQALQKEITNLQDNAYIEKVAREQLGLTKPGEIRYLTGKSTKLPDAQPLTPAP